MSISDTERPTVTHTAMKVLYGRVNGCEGCVGKTLFIENELPKEPRDLTEPLEQNEHSRYFAAHAACCNELKKRYAELKGESDEAWIFLMHTALLRGRLFTELPKLYISGGKSATAALLACREYFFDVMLFEEGGNNLRSVALDVEDVVSRLFFALEPSRIKNEAPPDSYIALCSSLFPSYIAANRKSIAGIVASPSFETSHAASLATSLGIPTLIYDGELDISLSDRHALIDTERACLCLEPDLSTLARFGDSIKQRHEAEKEEKRAEMLPSLTHDGKRITLLAELSTQKSLDSAHRLVCDGIITGADATMFCDPLTDADEEELFERYRALAEAIPTKPLMICATSVRPQVHLSTLISDSSQNEIAKLYVLRDSTLKTQLRAAMRAAVYGPVHFVLPQSGKYSDLFECTRIMEDVAAELYSEDREYSQIPLGSVIDSVASALMCARILQECDFVTVERERLYTELFGSIAADDPSPEDDVRVGALDYLLSSISKICEKASKKAVLSLGKNGSREAVYSALANGFSILSISADKLSAVKKAITQSEEVSHSHAR